MLEEARRVPTKRASNGGVSFDTQWVIDRLREGGWNEGQARALCDVLWEIMRGVATTSELGRVESSLRDKIEHVESSLRVEIKRVETSLEGQMASLRLIMLAGFGFLGVLMALLGILVTFFGV